MTQKANPFWTNCFSTTISVFYPLKCSLCQQFSSSNPCVQCAGEMEPNYPVLEYRDRDVLDYQGSVFRYRGRAGQAVRCLKYERRTGLAPFMATAIGQVYNDQGLDPDLIVPVPIHWVRLATRGFNQADLLSRAMPTAQAALRRNRPTQPQAGLSTSMRLKNLRGAFTVTQSVEGKSILLIDDVVTSGQTARECARALREAGAISVGILAFCGEV